MALSSKELMEMHGHLHSFLTKYDGIFNMCAIIREDETPLLRISYNLPKDETKLFKTKMTNLITKLELAYKTGIYLTRDSTLHTDDIKDYIERQVIFVTEIKLNGGY